MTIWKKKSCKNLKKSTLSDWKFYLLLNQLEPNYTNGSELIVLNSKTASGGAIEQYTNKNSPPLALGCDQSILIQTNRKSFEWHGLIIHQLLLNTKHWCSEFNLSLREIFYKFAWRFDKWYEKLTPCSGNNLCVDRGSGVPKQTIEIWEKVWRM